MDVSDYSDSDLESSDYSDIDLESSDYSGNSAEPVDEPVDDPGALAEPVDYHGSSDSDLESGDYSADSAEPVDNPGALAEPVDNPGALAEPVDNPGPGSSDSDLESSDYSADAVEPIDGPGGSDSDLSSDYNGDFHSNIGRELEIPRMELVGVTIDGYHGTEKSNLKCLIKLCGASYIKKVDTRTTHLISWNFQERKFLDAEWCSWISIVNHRWLEECLKEGKPVLEGPYSQCGQAVEPISSELLDSHAKGKSLLTRESGQEAGPSSCGVLDVFDSDPRGKPLLSYLRGRLQKIPGMESVDVSINGYRGTEKFRLKRLIKLCGARYFATVIEPTTHLICRQREGRNYDLAIEYETSIVNHLWLEDCLKEEKLLPLAPYLHCGQDVRPISCEALYVFDCLANAKHLLTRGRKTLLNEGTESGQEVGPTSFEVLDVCNRQGKSLLTPKEKVEMLKHLYGPKDYQEDGTRKPAHGSGTSATNVHGEPASADVDVACAICHKAFSSDRGRLSCRHKFCFKCIKKWQRLKFSEGVVPDCPLCKKPFKRVDWWPFADLTVAEETKLEETKQKEKEQRETERTSRMFCDIADLIEPVDSVCSICGKREPETSLIFCDFCRCEAVHSCCLDAPSGPWTSEKCMALKKEYEHCFDPPIFPRE